LISLFFAFFVGEGLAVIIWPSPTFFEISSFTFKHLKETSIQQKSFSISFHSIVYKSFVLLHGNLNQPIYTQLSTKQQKQLNKTQALFLPVFFTSDFLLSYKV